jgi:glycosyltransferase involved in cell wall biosynthesis
MKILIAHNDYGAPSGEEHAVSAISDLLSRNGHRLSRLHRSSAEITSVGGKVQAFLSGLYSFRSRRQMCRALAQETPELVLVQNLYPFLSPSILPPCREHGVPVVMRCPNYRLFCPSGLHLSHGKICERCLGGKEYWCVLKNCESDCLKSLGYALRNAFARITQGILDNVGVFVVLSEFQKARFITQGIHPQRVEIVPNAVPQLNGPAKRELGELITYVGRASPEKGIEDFVAAARRLPRLAFAVAGSTERTPELVANSPANIRWLGFLNKKDLERVYAESSMVVFPFRWFEGFPNVITQAMVMRRPVVAARIGAVPEIVVDGETGLLFEPGNVEDLVDKIQTLANNSSRCAAMGHAGQLKARSEYSQDLVYQRLVEVFEKARSPRFPGKT